MSKPKLWRTLEELNADHERLCAEVEELKKQFEGHVHKFSNLSDGGYDPNRRVLHVTMKTEK